MNESIHPDEEQTTNHMISISRHDADGVNSSDWKVFVGSDNLEKCMEYVIECVEMLDEH